MLGETGRHLGNMPHRLFEAIDPEALAFPQYLTRDRTIHRHQRSLTEGVLSRPDCAR